MENSLPKIIVIVGPTASGKTDLAIKIAKKFDGEIISADSRQVYKGMNIGTGKVTKKEMAGIPHHLLDVASPRRTFTVAHYQKLGSAAIKKILSKGKLPIIVGGTGFYIDTLLYNYNLPSVKQNLKLRHELEKKSAEELFNKLKKLDPRRAETIDRHNKVRLIRAIEIVIATKKPVPKLALWQSQGESQYNFLKIGVKIGPKKLKERIKKRLMARFKDGMTEEVKMLRKKGLSWKKLDSFGLEYRFISRSLRRIISKKEMEETLEQEIWKYSKRQMTWFRKDKKIKWVKKESEAFRLTKPFLSE
ncbi:MAG: tRNA (adenosine(37)-N6)-dimethylallyltransferase MiaA [Candidatus Liptonbacteria bacterium]|nr:tRNA (adenosine(37)-N6)-dimethylallyltransferase MiaA [Candidatus Liptonbacteria bacterium]